MKKGVSKPSFRKTNEQIFQEDYTSKTIKFDETIVRSIMSQDYIVEAYRSISTETTLTINMKFYDYTENGSTLLNRHVIRK